MKKMMIIMLSLLGISGIIFADTRLSGLLGTVSGGTDLPMNTPTPFARTVDPNGRLVVLSVELVRESDTESTLRCVIDIQDAQGQRSQMPPQEVSLKYGVDTPCLFPVSDTQALSITLNAIPSFLAAMSAGQTAVQPVAQSTAQVAPVVPQQVTPATGQPAVPTSARAA